MADDKFPTVLVRWEGNNSKRCDNTKEEILVSNIVAINKTAVIESSLDQISVGRSIDSRVSLYYLWQELMNRHGEKER